KHSLSTHQSTQLADVRVERLQEARRAARAAVDHQVLRALCNLEVEVVHQHAHGRLLRPDEAGDLRPARGANGPAHCSLPVTDSAASMTAPLRMRVWAAASSGATNRSGPARPTCLRSKARTAAVAAEASSRR